MGGREETGMVKRLVLFFVSCLLLVGLGVSRVAAQGDCDNNAIVRCGAFTLSDLHSKMTGDIPAIYAHYGITSSN